MSSQLHVPCTDAQEHFNSYTQPLINLVSAHILARVRLCLFQLHNSLQFVFVCLFYKIKTKEHSNLQNATLLRCFRFCVGENSRTFQDCIVEFKDFSRILDISGLFKAWKNEVLIFQASSFQLLKLENSLRRSFFTFNSWSYVICRLAASFMLDLQIGHLCKLSSLIAFSLLMNKRS